MMEKIVSNRLNREYYSVVHEKSGLRMLLCPMKGWSTSYVMLGTPYGSVDVCFKTDKDPDFVTVPAGIAHFLEHKLFENEDCDAFERYAKTGASANAYTSFDRTCYLFECGEHFEESLRILMDFVTHPYFTEATVQKEQGIIGQEIRMYDDNPDWRVMFNLLCALYEKNPVRTDIAGTVESIAQITPELLYRCYHTFYNLHNMVFVAAGNFDPETVLKVADELLEPSEPVNIEYRRAEEKPEIFQEKAEQKLAVSTPLFEIGFKAVPGDYLRNAETSILDEMLLEIIGGEASPLYRRLYDASLINVTFGGECMASRDYVCNMFSGESRDPYKVREELLKEVRAVWENGVDPELFKVAKATVYGRYLSAFDVADGVASLMMSGAFCGLPMFDFIERVAAVTPEQLDRRIRESFCLDRCAISVVWPSNP